MRFLKAILTALKVAIWAILIAAFIAYVAVGAFYGRT
jgi:hypothetical protein